MFGSEFAQYSEEELFKMGYKLENSSKHILYEEETEQKEELKVQIIKFIMRATQRYTKDELEAKSLDQLKIIYNTLSEEIAEMPTVNEISHQLRLGTKKS
jgi:hypothetical protein